MRKTPPPLPGVRDLPDATVSSVTIVTPVGRRKVDSSLRLIAHAIVLPDEDEADDDVLGGETEDA